MQSATEDAYFLFLIGAEYRAPMIAVGVDALAGGFATDDLALLASADYDSDCELVTTFRRAASDLGVELPTGNKEQDWIVLRTLQYSSEGKVAPSEDIDIVFKRNFGFIYRRLACLSRGDGYEPIRKFCEWFGKFVGETGKIDNYEEWLGQLITLEETVKGMNVGLLVRDVVSELTSLICGVSYGATENCHLRSSEVICRKTLEL